MSKKDDDQKPDDQIKSEKSAESAESEDLDQLKEELEQVKDTASKMENQLKRALADYQNLEKRIEEGRLELSSWASSDLVKRILPVVHNFEQVVQGVNEDERKSGWFKGVEMSVKQLQEVLKSEGVGEIEADGQFDPSLHEAVDTAEGEHDKILGVVEKGYTLNGKVLQPVKVVVGRKK